MTRRFLAPPRTAGQALHSGSQEGQPQTGWLRCTSLPPRVFASSRLASYSCLSLSSKRECARRPLHATYHDHSDRRGASSRPPAKSPDREPGRKKRNALTVGVNAYVCRRFEIRSSWRRALLFADVGRLREPKLLLCYPDALRPQKAGSIMATSTDGSGIEALKPQAKRYEVFDPRMVQEAPARASAARASGRGSRRRFVEDDEVRACAGSRHQHRLVSATMIRRRFRDDSYRGSSFPCAWMIFASAFRFGRNPRAARTGIRTSCA